MIRICKPEFYSLLFILAMNVSVARGEGPDYEEGILLEAEDSCSCTISGKHRVITYPRSVGRQVVILQQGARLTSTIYAPVVYLRLPPLP
jgi:hypothetical protein